MDVKRKVHQQSQRESMPAKASRRLKKKQQQRQKARENARQREFTKVIGHAPPTQHTLHEFLEPDPSLTEDEIAELSRPIGPTGDPLLEKREGIVRFGFQNIMGLSIKEGHTILPEAASIHALQLDFVGIVEPNRVMTHENKEKISSQLNCFAGQSKRVCSSRSDS